MEGSSGVTVLMVTTEFLEVGLNIICKAAMRRGMSDFVFVFYSNAAAIFFLLPASFFFYRKRPYPPLTCSIVCRIFVLGLISCSTQMLKFFGIGYGSPTLASAMTDLTPAFTFLLAIIFRMEKLDLRIQSSQAKSIGTIVSITGALIVTLYKDPALRSTSSMNKLLSEPFLTPASNWIIGGFFLAAHSLVLAVLFVVKTWIIRQYPAELIVTLICSIFVSINSAIISLIAENDPNAWRLRPDMELIAIGFSALFVVAIRNLINTRALRKKGPVYVSMFKPLGMVIAFVMGITFLGDHFYLGSAIGAAIIALGFYAVIWGQAQEEKRDEGTKISSFNSSSPKVPLLQNHRIDA